MNIYIIEGLDKTGKTTYTKSRFTECSKVRMPGGYDYTQEMRANFLEGKIPKNEMIHLLFGEHMAVLSKLCKEKKDYVLDRSFISFLAYQKADLVEHGYYETYKGLLEEKFLELKKRSNIRILYFSKRLISKKEDWLEHMDTDDLKKNFDELLGQAIYKGVVDKITIGCSTTK